MVHHQHPKDWKLFGYRWHRGCIGPGDKAPSSWNPQSCSLIHGRLSLGQRRAWWNHFGTGRWHPRQYLDDILVVGNCSLQVWKNRGEFIWLPQRRRKRGNLLRKINNAEMTVNKKEAKWRMKEKTHTARFLSQRFKAKKRLINVCLLYTSPSPRD